MPDDEPLIYWQPGTGMRGMTELHNAAWHGDLETVLAELEAGADVNARDQNEWTPLHWLVDMGMVGEGREDIMKALLKAGANLEVRNTLGETPLLRVCSSGNEDLARLLVEAGADLTAHDNEGWSPMGLAVRDGYEEIVAVLLEHGASPDERTASGETMLELARRREWNVVATVLESWTEARQQGTDWLALLANAPEEFDEQRFLKHLDAIMLGSGIILGLRSTFPDLLDDASEELPLSGSLMRDFIADYFRFLDRTSLVFMTHYYHQDLCIVFRTRFRYNPTAEDWARLQSEWATHNLYRGHPWSWKNFRFGCADGEMCHGMKRFVEILKRHRNLPKL